MVEELAHRRLVIVTGKGGVGKSTVAAALALESARAGHRTLVCEVNAKERVARLLGRATVGPEVTLVEDNLWAVNVRPQEAMREYVMMTVKLEAVYSAVFENRMVQYFLRFIPSLQELVLLGKILFHAREKRKDGSPRFDRIIIDAPATGHAVTFFSVPQVLLDTLPPGGMLNDVLWMRDLLVDPASAAVVLVSLPEELPVTETVELHQALTTKVKLHPRLVVLNQATAQRFTAADSVSDPGLEQVIVAHRALAQAPLDAHGTLAGLGLPVRHVPRLYVESFGRAAVEAVGQALGGSPR